MKTTKALLLILLLTGLSTGTIHAADTNEECLRQSVQSLVIAEFHQWDFKEITENEAVADVEFQLQEDGSIMLCEVYTDNKQLANLIKQNFEGIQLKNECGSTEKTFLVRLKHRRV